MTIVGDNGVVSNMDSSPANVHGLVAVGSSIVDKEAVGGMHNTSFLHCFTERLGVGFAEKVLVVVVAVSQSVKQSLQSQTLDDSLSVLEV